jgi:hypothetical protein
VATGAGLARRDETSKFEADLLVRYLDRAFFLAGALTRAFAVAPVAASLQVPSSPLNWDPVQSSSCGRRSFSDQKYESAPAEELKIPKANVTIDHRE